MGSATLLASHWLPPWPWSHLLSLCNVLATTQHVPDCEIFGGAWCGDLPLWQLLALHHRQKREEGRVNLGGTFKSGSGGFWTLLTSCESSALTITFPCILIRNPLFCVSVISLYVCDKPD